LLKNLNYAFFKNYYLIKYSHLETVSAFPFKITGELESQFHFTQRVPHFKFNLINLFFTKSHNNIQATTLAHAQVPQAKVSHAHLS